MKIVTDKILGRYGAEFDESKNHEVECVRKRSSGFQDSCYVRLLITDEIKFGWSVDATVECLDDEGYPL